MKHARLIQLLALLNTIIAILGMYSFSRVYHIWFNRMGICKYIWHKHCNTQIYAHRSFRTGAIREKILKYLTIIPAFCSPLSWTAQHRYHHRYVGHPVDDNQSPDRIGYVRAFLLYTTL